MFFNSKINPLTVEDTLKGFVSFKNNCGKNIY